MNNIEKEQLTAANLKILKKLIGRCPQKVANEFPLKRKPIYFSVDHRSASGMMRVVNLFVVHKGEIERITGFASQFLDRTYNRKHEGIQVGGCGFCPGNDLIQHLSRKLFDDPNRLRPRRL